MKLLPCVLCVCVVLGAADNGSVGYRHDGSGVHPSALTPLAQAEKCWESEATVPTSYVGKVGTPGGYGSLAFADGRVFFSCYEPTGSFVQERKLQRIKGKNFDEKYALTDAHDVLLCVDLKTGKTLWRAVSDEISYNPCSLGGELFATPCVVGDRVYSYGNLGRVYAHDVVTGAVLWQTWLPGGKQGLEKLQAWKDDDKRYKRVWKKNKIRAMVMKNGGALARSPMHVAGVVLVHDYKNGLAGLDAKTGKLLWESPRTLDGKGATPIPFGDDQVLAGGSARLVCLDARSGEAVWRIKGYHGFGFGVAAHGPWIVTRGGHKTGAIMCWQVIDGKPVKQWEGPSGHPSGSGVIIRDGHVWGVFAKDPSVKKGPLLLRAFDLATGAVTGEVETGGAKPDYTHLASSDGLIAMSSYSARGTQLFAADPLNPRLQGPLLPDTTFCITPAMADGLLLKRSRDRIVCWRIAR